MPKLFHSAGRAVRIAALVCAGFVFQGCAEAESQEPANSPATPQAQQSAASDQNAAPQVPPAPPEGTGPAELLEYIKTIEKQRPQGESQAEVIAWYQATRRAIVGAADRVLASDLSEMQRLSAINAKQQALALLVQAETPGATEQLRTFNESLLKDKDPDVAQQAWVQLLRVRLTNLMAGTEPPEKLVADIKEFTSQGEPDQLKFAVLAQTAQVLEHSQRYAEALDLYEQLGKLFAGHENEQYAETAATYQQAASRRLGVVGKPIQIHGPLLSGEQVNWAQYKDKVVLVDFWATWCGPCLAELPNVREQYEKYHERGFEVLGVSIDSQKSDVEEFYESQKLPWPTVWESNEEGESVLAEQYGIMAIPAALLVGKDGKVITLSARGEKLGEHLAQLLGPVPDEDKTAVE